MAERSLSERISLAIQNKVYEVADVVTTVVDEALEAFEDAAKSVESAVTPVYNVNVYSGDTEQPAEQAPSQTGGSGITIPLSLRDTLGVVYDYLYENDLLEDDLEGLSKDMVVGGYRSTLSSNFKTVVYKSILGAAYSPEWENN